MNAELDGGSLDASAAEGAPAEAGAAQPQESQATTNQEPQSFEDMGLRPEVKQALLDMGFLDPMPVQRVTYHKLMAGRDLMVQSRTGSGKTAAFGIPFAQGLIAPEEPVVQALVLAPTRELALQVATECGRIGKHRDLKVVPIYGGAPMNKQIDMLQAGGQIVAGTPGRVLDHLRRGTLKLSALRVLVLDEADEMLSMGFLEEITDIIKRCPTERQTILFSATIPDDIERIGSRYMREPEKIQLSVDGVAPRDIKHAYYMVSGMGRARDLARVLEVERPESAIIFCNTRDDTNVVAEFLRKSGLDAEAISSDLTQRDRERVMGLSKEKQLKYLVATDIAARGIDITDLSHVINYTFPESAEVYVHRTGRTGRAGKSGVAISLISPRELGNFYMLKLTYKIKPEERTLPSEAELKSSHEASRVEELRSAVGARELGEEWRAVARRLWSAEDGERIVATLIQERLTRAAAPVAETAVPTTGGRGGASGANASARTGDAGAGNSAAGDSGAADAASAGANSAGAAGSGAAGSGAAGAGAASAGAAGTDESGAERPGRERPERDRDARRARGRRGGRDRERGGRGGERSERGGRDRGPRADGARDSRGGEPSRSERGETSRGGGGETSRSAGGENSRGGGGETSRGAGGETSRGAGGETSRGEARAARGGRERDSGAPRPIADTIDTSDGREFWEAWVDSKSDSPAPDGTPSAAAGGTPSGAPAEAAPREREREPERVLPPGHVRLYLNLGRRDGVREPELQTLLTERGVTVESAQLRNSHTYLIVPESHETTACAALTGQRHGERDLVCERARK